MKNRGLGKTGIQVSEVNIGLWAGGGDAWVPVEDRDSPAAIERAREMGVTFRSFNSQRVVNLVRGASR